jgi:transposase
MTRAISEDLKKRIVDWYIIDGRTMEEIRDLSRCSIGLVYNTIQTYREYGQVTNPFHRRSSGRPLDITDDNRKFIESILSANPSLYLDEIQQRLWDVCGVETSIATISWTLHRMNLTRKQVAKEAAERNDQLRAIWEGMMAEYTDPDVFVAIDESAIDDKTGHRQMGWSRLGVPCVRRMTFLRGVRYSILPALTTDGIIALEVVEGSITKERFLTFLQEQFVSEY